ncbi:RND transporter [Sphingomonas sp. Leaf24]|uniref:efflux transporter outer membrane subunit n=1 Tax=unclassified Sphingomonas TaxID=196159 RepID=UPI0006F21914|nr:MULTISPECIES: efflux transporter outer membrane subunit [unclassified Sphingomonas]KQM22433.1 RND transporter [Sphingomonas sp. Leaf5]KQM94026.1 RND transporter [Sphingomonas sp. Leaf24]
MTRSFPLSALLLLGACTVGPNYAGPPATASDATRFVRATDAALTPAPGLARWWEGLNDPLLTRLVDDALIHSPTIDLSTARLREARARLTQQRVGQLPSASANGTAIFAELPPIQPDAGGTSASFYNLGLNASWEADLFGGGRRTVEQARATAGARQADLADAQVSLSAAVAQAYVALRDVQARIGLSDANTRLQQRQLDLTRQRFAAGTASQLAIERLQTQLENTQADAIPLAAQRDEYLNQLAVLTGRTPGTLDATLTPPAPVPLPPQRIAVGDPAALIARRPDIRAAERQLAAGTAAIGTAKARELPGIRFLGLLGLGGTSPEKIFDLGNLAALAVPSLNWSFLDFGRAKAATRVSEAQRDQADATYRRTVLDALQDAETALSRFGNRRRQLGQLVQVEATAARAAALNRQRVAAGTATLIDQLDIERQQVAAASAVAQARAGLTQSYIAVNKALGLGWTDPVSADAAPRTTAADPSRSAR